MADKYISSSNRAFDPISSSAKLFDDTNEHAASSAPPPPAIRSKESEQNILDRQRAAKSSLMQTQTDPAPNPSLQPASPVESAKPVSTGTNLPPVSMFVKFIHNGRTESRMFDNVSDISELFADIKQRYEVKGALSLFGAGKRINGMSEVRASWASCEGMFHVVSSD